MRKTILTILLLTATLSFMGCCNSQTQAKETKEMQVIEPVDTLANIPMTVKFMSIYIPCTVNGKTKLFLLDPEWEHNCIEKRYISDNRLSQQQNLLHPKRTLQKDDEAMKKHFIIIGLLGNLLACTGQPSGGDADIGCHRLFWVRSAPAYGRGGD